MEAMHECCECGRVGEWRWACTIWEEWGACGGDCEQCPITDKDFLCDRCLVVPVSLDLDEFAF